MNLLLRFFQKAFVLLTLLGGFPYTEIKTLEKRGISVIYVGSDFNDSKENFPYKRSRLLEILVPCGLFMIYAFFISSTIWVALEVSYTPELRGHTYAIADIIEDVVNMSSVVVLGIYFILKTSSARDLVSFFIYMLKLLPDTLTKKAFSHVKFIPLLLLYTLANIISMSRVISSLWMTDGFTRVNESLELVFNWTMTTFTLLSYYTSVCLICTAYSFIHESIAAAESESRFSCKFGRKFDSNQVGHKSEGNIFKSDQRRAATLKNDPQDQRRPSLPIETAKNLLSDVHSFHQLLHDFLGFPIVVILAFSLVAAILTVSFLFYKGSKSQFENFLNMGYVSAALLPIIMFLNIPVTLQKKETELKRLVNKLRRNTTDPNLKHEMDILRDILDDSPGFELCHLFTLGRARILDIFSYTATYLVILLQFKSNEGEPACQLNRTELGD